mgnify:CR=1 FL=1
MGARKSIRAEKLKAEKKQTAIAVLRDCPTSPLKMRIVADMIRGMEINKALGTLRYSKKAASIRLEKLLRSAIANWEQKNEGQRLEDNTLCVKEIFVDGGKMLKRIQPAPQGRAHRIRKRSNHVTVVVDKMVVKADKKVKVEIDLLNKIKETLEAGKSARTLELNEEELELIKDSFLLTLKPILYIANVSEDQLGNDNDELVNKVKEYASKEKANVIPLCVKIEEELSSLDGEDKKEMLEALGLEESGLDKVIKASYDLLGLMSFLTAGEPEVRAWTIKKGTKAPEAAGKIHSDIQRGFIRAEVVKYDDLIREGSMNAVKEKGLLRSEGKDYIMQDGDIVLFRFNV